METKLKGRQRNQEDGVTEIEIKFEHKGDKGLGSPFAQRMSRKRETNTYP
jgi:hypothetical protein